MISETPILLICLSPAESERQWRAAQLLPSNHKKYLIPAIGVPELFL